MNRIIVLILLCFFLHQNTFSQTPASDPHWKINWEDNFDFFDPLKWIKQDYLTDDGPQLYLQSNVWVENSNLVLRLNNTRTKNIITGNWHDYTSGDIHSSSAYPIKYGYLEARIKFPFKEGKIWGFWPAFWTTLGYNVINPTSAAEIDICEIFGGEDNSNLQIGTCLHRCYSGWYTPYFPSPCNNGDMGQGHTISSSYTNWHTYAIEWDVNRITWYIDGKAIRTTVKHLIVDPIRIILNLAIQGQKKYHPPTSPPFEEKMYVDYVKVYSLKCDKNTVVTQIPNFNTYNYAVKKSISLSNTTTIPAGSNITLRANDFIELKPGFEVQTDRELYLDVSPCSNSSIIYKPYDPNRN